MYMILLSLIAGVLGMGLGGFFTALFGSKSDKLTGIFLSFSGGVMISIAFVELIPEAIELSGAAIMVAGLFLGAVLVFALHYLMDNISHTGGKSKIHDTFAEYFHSGDIISNKPNMLRSGMIMIFAIGLHNVPEGLAMGAAGNYDAKLGLTLAIIIGLHNIPEGMAVSAPLILGGLSKTKAVVITLLAGATTVLGAAVGVLIGSISDIAVSLSFGAAAGAMLYVVLGEILPQSIVMSKDRIPTIFAFLGMVAGMLFTKLLH
ncbi:MAG: ZIP family metal transporter [Oscillospiraceae bacterium]|nr:ZIP family metal transporter [Oscillospiraceae bacterium]